MRHRCLVLSCCMFFALILVAGVCPVAVSADTIVRGDGNDIIAISPGNHTVDGGGGDDTLALPFFPNVYSFTPTGATSYTVGYLDYTLEIDNIEYVEFGTDTLTKLSIYNMPSGEVQTQLAKLTDLYLAFFGRAPDVSGLEYWQEQILSGRKDFVAISKDFSWSPEAQALFPANGSNRDFVQTVYQNCFGRDPDAGGWDYWTNKLDALDPNDPDYLNDRGAFVGELLLGAYAPTSGEEDRSLLTNRHEVAMYYVNWLSEHPEEAFDAAINDLLVLTTGAMDTQGRAKYVVDYVFTTPVSLTEVMNDPVLLECLWFNPGGSCDEPSAIDADGDNYTVSQGDCNDADISINPAATEICGDGIDQDCSGADLTCPVGIDNDSDGFTAQQGDCDDNNSSINPQAAEVCDGLDNDCDGQVDEGLAPTDADADGYYSAVSCGAFADDCNDHDAGIHPGALDIPYDQIDQDCSGADLNFDAEYCTACHGTTNLHDYLHDLTSAPDNTCTLCHAAPVSNVLSGHYGDTVRTSGNNMTAGATISCASCHDADNANHSGGFALGNGSNVVTAKIVAALPNITCDACHENRASLHATGTAHVNRVIDSSCGTCHTSDPSVLGSPGTGSLASAADVDALHRVVSAEACALCHNYTGTLLDAGTVRQAIEQGLNGAQVTCIACHTDKGTNHGAFTHPVEVGPNDLSFDAPGLLCSNCHVVANWAEIQGVEHNVATNGVGSCATCHNSSRQEVIDAIALGANPTHCLTCHPNKNLTPHGTVDHAATGYVTGAGTTCLTCHDPGPAANATVTGTHLSNCSFCHTTVPNLQPGIPALGGSCATCHPSAWDVTHTVNQPDHSALVQATASCAGCHDNTLVSTAATTHNACSSCHDTDGSLRSLASGQDFTTGGNCATCHTKTWEATHTGHAHTVGLGGSDLSSGISCGACHAVANWTEIEGTVHQVATNGAGSCATCHNSARQDVIAAIAAGVNPTNCLACHSDRATAHGSVNHVATGFVTVTSPCADCHDPGSAANATVTATHLNNCTLCHTSIPALQPGLSAGGGDCATCHPGTWEVTHLSVAPDHSALVQATASCASCHDNTLVSAAATTHNACSSCHNTNGSLKSLAIGKTFTTGGNCATCHTASWETLHTVAPSHSGIVTVTGTSCASCHDSTLVSTATTTHNACSSCHNATSGALVSLATGKSAPGNCATCHTSPWAATHSGHAHTVGLGGSDLSNGISCGACHVVATWAQIEGTEHNVATNGAGSCATCHNSARPEVITAIATGANPTNCLNCHSNKTASHGNVNHVAAGFVTGGTTSCMTCHDPGTAANATVDVTHGGNCSLCHTTVPNLKPGVSAGNCNTCHTTTWEATHTTNTPSHSALVQATASCASCHDNTLVSTAATTHNACSSCHNTNGSLKSLAIGKTFTTGGNCATCHTASWETLHTVAPSHSGIVTVTGTSCASCHDSTLVSTATTTHNACSSCHNATSGALVSLATGKSAPGNCATCHTSPWAATHSGHAHTVGLGGSDLSNGISCGACHVVATWAQIEGTEHNVATNGAGSCATCHNSARPEVITAIATGANPTNCLNCHSNKTASHGNVNHVAAGFVTGGTTSCMTCHDPGTAANATVDVTHGGNCSLCHTTVPNLKPGVSAGNCNTCHTTTWEATHTTNTPSHSALVQATASCASCHDNTLVSAAATTHNACSSCHNTNGSLKSLAIGKTFTTGGNCATCHTASWETLHTVAPSHSGIVTVTGTSCASCHDSTLVSTATTTHNACSSCHNATTGLLKGLATGKSAPGNCTTCHTSTWAATHSGHAHTVGLGGSDLSNGISCGACHVVATWAQIEGTEHNVATNGAGSCATCHNSARPEVITAIATGANPTNCLNCHSNKTSAHGSVNHVAAGYVTVTSPCADCHNPGSAANATVDVTHGGNCSLCHTTVPALKPGVAAGGGNCATCHGANVQTVHPSCTTCHGEPPSGTTAPNRERAHAEHAVLGFGSVNPSCNACHAGATHYNGTAEVNISSSFNAKSGTASSNGSTCSSTRCHGGQTTPSWATGSLNVNTQCNSCHASGTSQYNSYNSGEHRKHVVEEGFACAECHSVSKLANGHFSNLATTSFELSPGLTIGGSDTTVNSRWNDSSNTCSNLSCHGKNHSSEDIW